MLSTRVLIALITSIALLMQAIRWWNLHFDATVHSYHWWIICLVFYEAIWSVCNIYIVFELAGRLTGALKVWNRVAIHLLILITALLIVAQLAFARQVFETISR